MPLSPMVFRPFFLASLSDQLDDNSLDLMTLPLVLSAGLSPAFSVLAFASSLALSASPGFPAGLCRVPSIGFGFSVGAAFNTLRGVAIISRMPAASASAARLRASRAAVSAASTFLRASTWARSSAAGSGFAIVVTAGATFNLTGSIVACSSPLDLALSCADSELAANTACSSELVFAATATTGSATGARLASAAILA